MSPWIFLCGFLIGMTTWLLAQVYLIKKHYVTARMTRKLPQLIKPMVRTMDPQKIKEMRAGDNDSPEESCMWLNVIFARLWSELRDTEAFSHALKELLHSELIDLKRDPIGVILGEPADLRLSDIYLGDSAPNLDNVTVLSQRNLPRQRSFTSSSSSMGSSASSMANSVPLVPSHASSTSSSAVPSNSAAFSPISPQGSSSTPTPPTINISASSTSPSSSTSASPSSSDPSTPTSTSPTAVPPSADSSASSSRESAEFSVDPELSVIFDVNYLGGCAFVAEIPTTLGFFFTISFRLSELSGRMFVQFREKPDSTFSFAFYDMPKMKTEIHVLINGTEFGLFTRFFEKQMLEVFREKLVLPNMKTKWFMNGPEQPPYPWDLKEGQTEADLYNWKPKVELASPLNQERNTPDLKTTSEVGSVPSGKDAERAHWDPLVSSEGGEATDHQLGNLDSEADKADERETFGDFVADKEPSPRKRLFHKDAPSRVKTV